ncbi:MAG: RsiV family protein [Anaeromassilibacillus sp.]
MNKEDRIRDSKKIYDATEIPNGLSEVVQKAIQQTNKKGKVIQMKRYGKRIAATAACLVIGFIAALNISEPFAAAVAKVPVVGELVQVVTWRSYVYQDDDKTVQVEVPQIEGQENTSAVTDVNAQIQKIVADYEKQAEQNIAEYKEAFLATGGTEEEFIEKGIQVDVQYNVKYQSDTRLSLELIANENWCNAYNVQYFYNIDLKNEKTLTLEDILGEDYISIANESIREQMQKRMEDDENLVYWDGSDGIEGFTTVDENTKFYLNEKGNPVVVFAPYEIAPGAFGAQEFEIIL